MSFEPVNDPRLASDDPGVRRIAVLDIADAEDDADLPALITALLADQAAQVRAEAARVLGGWGHPLAVDALAQALLDADAGVRANAATALAQLKDAAAGECLLPWALHDDPAVRAAALRGLKELRIPAAAAPARAALGHRDAGVRREAVGVLGWLK
ncbi:MAG TPA: HEAT repeat domain-containing protein, partial [Burkholderiaceae bacterium]